MPVSTSRPDGDGRMCEEAMYAMLLESPFGYDSQREKRHATFDNITGRIECIVNKSVGRMQR